MAGIYIHVPFCKTRCIYCDFYSNTGLIHKPYLNALYHEIDLRRDYLQGEAIETIYLGGGTPSQLDVASIQQILEHIFKVFDVRENAEITLEANPDDMTPSYISHLSALPVNRLSMGVQSFDDQALKFLKRRHSGEQASDVVKRCQDNGFDNLSIDLMYGLPNQSLHDFEENIQKAIHLDVQHISAYHLIYEKGTKLFRMLEKEEVRPVDEELSVDMFRLLINTLTQAGFEHYEISNFARNGKYSKHNTSYWQGISYLGLGPSAHSYNGKSRQWNIASLNRYVASLKTGVLNAEIEPETPEIRYNETILTGLRTKWGVNLSRLENEFGKEFLDYCLRNADKYLKNNLLVCDSNYLKLTLDGIFVSDGVMSDLMWV
ncbi:MAG: radical SAM family heme chaperone HemW [Dysgonamonadaceae bacterium]